MKVPVTLRATHTRNKHTNRHMHTMLYIHTVTRTHTQRHVLAPSKYKPTLAMSQYVCMCTVGLCVSVSVWLPSLVKVCTQLLNGGSGGLRHKSSLRSEGGLTTFYQVAHKFV
jgi:hypothetical protein